MNMSLIWPTELRQAARRLARTPGFTVVAVLVLSGDRSLP